MDEVRIHRLRRSGSDVTSLVRKFTTTSVGCFVGVTTPLRHSLLLLLLLLLLVLSVSLLSNIDSVTRKVGCGRRYTCDSTPTRSLLHTVHICVVYVRVFDVTVAHRDVASRPCVLATLSPFYLGERVD